MISTQQISVSAKEAHLQATKKLNGHDLLVALDDKCFVVAGFENPNVRNEVSIRCMELVERTGCHLVGIANSSEGSDCLVKTINPATVAKVKQHAPEVFGDGVKVRFRM